MSDDADPVREDVLSSKGEILLYPTEDGKNRIECRFEEQTLWLSQAALVELYQTTKANISIHLKHIFEEGELRENSVVKSYLTTAADGKNYRVKHYNLEAVLAVGYRVRSVRGTQFRQWATARLQEYLVKGFAMDDERLKRRLSEWTASMKGLGSCACALKALDDGGGELRPQSEDLNHVALMQRGKQRENSQLRTKNKLHCLTGICDTTYI